MDSAKASQDTDISTKVIKDNADIFSDFLLSGFNSSVTTSIFPSSIKQALTTPVFEKETKIWKKTISPSEYYQMYRRYLSDSRLNKFLTSWKLSSQSSVVFGKAIAHSIAFYRCLKNGNQRSIKKNIFWCTFDRFIKILWLYFSQTCTCKTKCVWFYPESIKIVI